MAISAGDAVLELGLDATTFNSGLENATNKLNQAVNKWGRGMKIAGGVMVGAVAGVSVASLKMASDFDTAMREVNTMMLLNEEEFKALSKDVRQLAKDMGIDAVEAANALYQAISAGVPKENVLEFLEVASKAAIGGTTDVITAVDGLTTVLNAFKIPVKDAQRVADIMFTTVKGGKTTFEELSASLFNVAPMAAAANIKFEEVAAALATMTKQGVPTSVATTQLRQAIVGLTKPTTEMEGLIANLGYSSGAAMLEELGLAKALAEVEKYAKANNMQVTDLFGSIEGGSAVLALAGENAEVFTADLEAMKDAAGATQDAVDQMEQSTSRQFTHLMGDMKDMAISIGNSLMPALQSILKIVTPIIEKVGAWLEKNPALTATILAVVGGVGGLLLAGGFLLPMISGLIAAAPMLGAAFTAMMGPVGLIIAGIAALIAIGVLVWKNWDTIKEKAKQIWESIVGFFKNIWESIVGLFKEHWDKILAILFPAVGIPILIARNWEKVKDALLTPFRLAAKGIENAVNWIIKQLNRISFDVPDWVPVWGGKHFGFDIKEISLPTFKEGTMLTEPTLLYGLRSNRPLGIAGEAGPEPVGPTLQPTTTVNNYFQGPWFIREEADIDKIARRLYQLQRTKSLQAGVVG